MCEVFSREGADVAFSYNSREDLAAEMSGKIEAYGRRAFNAKISVIDRVGMKKLTRELVEKWGGIDILVNNAGIAVCETILEAKVEHWDLVQAVNLRAPFLLAQALAPGMIERRMGKIQRELAAVSQRRASIESERQEFRRQRSQ